MGLREYRQYKKEKEILSFLKEYGITKDDLSYLHEALEIIKTNQMNRPVVIDEETKKEMQKAISEKLTPEQIVKAFAGETEEFYPYGKPKE